MKDVGIMNELGTYTVYMREKQVNETENIAYNVQYFQ